MAAPREIYIYADCELEIEIDLSKYGGIDHTDSSMPWKYTVKSGNFESTQTFEGLLSPTAAVTLPPMIKQIAGIPKKAASFAFMYPPKGLNEVAGGDLGIESVATLGGFVYFDKNHQFICINALSLGRSERTLKFSGPFDVTECASEELHKLGRAHPLQLDIFNEIGYVSYAWVRPRELLQFQSVLVGDKHPNTSGTMVFFQEDGSGVAYAVDPSGYTDPTAYGGILSDAIQRIGQSKLTRHTLLPIDEIRAWKDKVKYIFDTDLRTTLIDKRSLLHMSCHAVLGYEFVLQLLSSGTEENNLLHQDSHGWNPLHYACRFSPKDFKLIDMLVKKCPDAVLQSDNYGRMPLHIACNSDTSKEVIRILIEADKSSPKTTITQETHAFRLLPIHFACYNGLSIDILNLLLDADHDGKTTTIKSLTGQLPLHIAIMKKLPANMVKALLDADSKLNRLICPKAGEERSPFDSDIYQTFDGKLPLHLACANNSSSEIVQLLIEKDHQNTTISEKVDLPPVPGIMQSSKTEYLFKSTRSGISVNSLSRGGDSVADQHGIVALHLAMIHGVPGVINLLLRKEMEKANSRSGEIQLSSLCMVDPKGRTPLHIACENNVSPKIIQFLLKLDPNRETTQTTDDQGFMPIHYACQNYDTNVETVDFLLAAEDKFHNNRLQDGEHVNDRRSTHTGCTERKRTPLFLAVKSNSSIEIIERLLKSENFYLNGFDDDAMSGLADIVGSSSALQTMIIDRLSERAYFTALLFELMACLWAVSWFMIGTNRFREGQISRMEPTFLILSNIVFMMRELLQILSVGSEYIGDLWSWFEIGCIVLSLTTASAWLDEAAISGNGKPSNDRATLLSLTAFFIIIQFIIYLRSTFLPFARFVGGLLMIMLKLMPFLVVSILLMLAFVFANWVHGNCKSLANCFELSYKDLFEFDPEHIGVLQLLFGFFIVIILLNVVIAIVGEAWGSALEKSTRMFWQYRLDKLYELRYAVKLSKLLTSSSPGRVRNKFLHWVNKVDDIRSISLSSDVSWSKPPYNQVTEKKHYERPEDYFAPDVADKIYDTHSLESDLYWAEFDKNFTYWMKMAIFWKWYFRCSIYVTLIILGIPTCGVFWPQKFRAGALSLGLKKPDDEASSPPKSDNKKSKDN